jgi:leader peptidase (prepilin peptidase)/N-methyltransferase
MTISEIQLLISLLPLAYVGGAVIPIISSDVRVGRVPNKMVVPLMVLTLLSWLTLAIWQGAWFNLGISILFFIGTILLGSFLNIKFGVIGMGDVKLLATLSMILGWFSWGVALAFLPMLAVLSLVVGFFVVMLSNVKVLGLSPMAFLTFGFALAIVFNH